MAITAKVDVYPVAANTAVTTQPASGEVWLIKSIALDNATGSSAIRFGLYDGTDYALVAGENYAATASYTPGISSHLDTMSSQSINTNVTVIVTNAFYMRWYSVNTARVVGYSGVLL